MLVLSRKAGEQIHIGSDVVLTIVDISGKFAKIGITAPDNIIILRGEVKEQIEYENQLAASLSAQFDGLKQLGSIWEDTSENSEK